MTTTDVCGGSSGANAVEGPAGLTNRLPAMRRRPLAPRPLTEPAPSRFALDHPRHDEILAAHARAMAQGAVGYDDPESGLLVFTASYLVDRGTCCDAGCRHCPYTP